MDSTEKVKKILVSSDRVTSKWVMDTITHICDEDLLFQEIETILQKDLLAGGKKSIAPAVISNEDNWLICPFSPIYTGKNPYIVKVTKFLLNVKVAGMDIVISFAKIIPPDSIKDIIQKALTSKEWKESNLSEWQEAKSSYESVYNYNYETARNLSVQLLEFINEVRFVDKKYLFFPTATVAAYNERFSYNILQPFVSVSSLFLREY